MPPEITGDAERLQRMLDYLDELVAARERDRQLAAELGILRAVAHGALARGRAGELVYLEKRLRSLHGRITALPESDPAPQAPRPTGRAGRVARDRSE